MKSIFADLHIHIGRSESGQAVKISGSNNLTFHNIAHEASARKGIEMVGIIDCHSPSVQQDIIAYLDKGEMEEVAGGGIRYQDTTIILGSEIEVRDLGMKAAHLLAYFPNLTTIQDFTAWMRKHLKNIELSSQRIYVTAAELQEEVLSRGGIMVPAHIFTPHKGLYGACTDHMSALLNPSGIAAVELGLSADSAMAGMISELDEYTFLTNSDAHSLAKIGREYNQITMKEPSFEELRRALMREEGRGVIGNYGLNPRLGKYHRTYCGNCQTILDDPQWLVDNCASCGSRKVIRGVMDRVMEIADRKESYLPVHRPKYHYQVPLEFLPGLGPKKLEQLLDHFGTEMNVLHKAPGEALAQVVGDEIASYITLARLGKLEVDAGGGGTYGKILKS
ncbi:endonuclease Q family protein [Paenibacillus sp. N1-5-1-14]|uniref:endonuclease Q family protein n=1 Tax=Paenibacillus radicibacter TaxID=2972488 RepID=UPI002159ABFB|nr:endonuclease Q family protein [Paenibacillus radicibacter]MCR8642380.1 endonuclease Q family protein [Paenibacillus radicibacter]